MGKSGMCVNLTLHPAPDPPAELQSIPEPLEGPAPNPDPAPAKLVLEPVSPPSAPPDLGQAPTPPSAPGPAPELEPAGLPAPSPGPHNPGAVTTKPLVREEKCNILTFPPRQVAEQLTGMDVVSSGPLRMGGTSLPSAVSAPTCLFLTHSPVTWIQTTASTHTTHGSWETLSMPRLLLSTCGQWRWTLTGPAAQSVASHRKLGGSWPFM